MNFLAHAYLSFEVPEILVGNMISDFVKGKVKFTFSAGIQKGIELHRAIDAFTDIHAATREAKTYLHAAVGAYSGAFIDVVYDHFLANDQHAFENQSLPQLAVNTYNVLQTYADVLPARFRQMLPYMVAQNWLYNYRLPMGVESSFGGIVRRATYLNSSIAAYQMFKMHYTALQNCYNSFFPDVKTYAHGYLQQLIKQ